MDSHEHLVQFYGGDARLLTRNVSRYLAEGFARGEGLLLIATPGHVDAFASGLAERGLDVPRIVREGRLTVIDAQEMLGQIMADGMPDLRLFDDVMGRVLRTVRRRTGSTEVCAYGEMVDILWNAGEFGAAEALESCWNSALAHGGLRLFCAYSIDILGRGLDRAALEPILGSHSAVVPAGDDLYSALIRALDDVLGEEAGTVRERLASTRAGATTTGEMLAAGLLETHARAREILDRARYYQDFRPQPV